MPTSESQGHGKAYEIEVQKRCYEMTDEELSTYKQCDKYDIRKEHNRISQTNVSIKTSSSLRIDCGDIIRFLNSENMELILIIYKQNDDIKIAIKTIVFNYDDFKKILHRDIESLCGESYEEWILKVRDYDSFVKQIPYGKCEDKSYKANKKPLCDKIKYFNIAPKVDSKKQRRVQCSIDLNKIPDLQLQEFEGGELYGKTYTKVVKSEKRKRRRRNAVDVIDIIID